MKKLNIIFIVIFITFTQSPLYGTQTCSTPTAGICNAQQCLTQNSGSQETLSFIVDKNTQRCAIKPGQLIKTQFPGQDKKILYSFKPTTGKVKNKNIELLLVGEKAGVTKLYTKEISEKSWNYLEQFKHGKHENFQALLNTNGTIELTHTGLDKKVILDICS